MTVDDAEVRARRASVFGSLAAEYDRWRPGYPDEAVDWLLPPGARDVLDLGAGTGKLTASLVDRGLQVTVAEPDPAMLAVLSRHHPGATAHLAGADGLPLPAASVDAVLGTHSTVALMPEPAREELLDATEAVVAAEARRRGSRTVPLHRRSLCIRWRPGGW